VDVSTVLGLIVAIGSLVLGFLLEGGHLGGLVNISAALIVFGGTFGATCISLPMTQILSIPALLRQVIFSPALKPQEAIHQLVALSKVARRNGLLALQSEMEKVSDPFLRRALQLVVDGNDPEDVHHTLELELLAQERRHAGGEAVFASMGGYAPTLGVLGTVMGLVHMLAQLDEPGKMGPAIAAAFIATMYGVGSANVVFLPLAGKLKANSQSEMQVRELVREGILGMQAGANPLALEERLTSFLAPKQRGGGPATAPQPAWQVSSVAQQAEASQ
jgi:chemotaxis protein MotA